MPDLTNIFEFVIDSFDNGTFTRYDCPPVIDNDIKFEAINQTMAYLPTWAIPLNTLFLLIRLLDRKG